MDVIYSDRAFSDLEALDNRKTRDKVVNAINRYTDYSILELLKDPKVIKEEGVHKDRVVGIQKDVIRIFLKVDSAENKVTVLTIGNKKGIRGDPKEKKWLKSQLEVAHRTIEKEKI